MTATTPSDRLPGVDVVRGAAVLLVLLGHAYALTSTFALEVGGAPLPPSPTSSAQEGLRPLRMPLLLALSGFWLIRAVQQPLTVYVDKRVRGVLWPFIVWTILTVAAYSPGVRPVAPFELATGFLHMWFLVELMFCFAVGLLACWVSPLVLAGIMACVTLALPAATLGSVRTLFFWGFFFFVGAAAGRHRDAVHRHATPVVLAVLAALTLTIVVAVAWAHSASDSSTLFADTLSFHPDRAVGLLTGLPGVLLGLALLTRIPAVPLLSFAGRNSLIYYTAHVPVLLVTVRLWVAAGVPTSLWLPVAVALVTFVVCTVLAACRGTLEFLFTPPWPPLATRRRVSAHENTRI